MVRFLIDLKLSLLGSTVQPAELRSTQTLYHTPRESYRLPTPWSTRRATTLKVRSAQANCRSIFFFDLPMRDRQGVRG